MGSKLESMYCKNCRKVTPHESQGIDLPENRRYVCIECLNTNTTPQIIKTHDIIKAGVSNGQG